MNKIGRNRIFYISIFLMVVFLAWLYGERMLYVSAFVLVALPGFSYLMAYAMLRGLKVEQTIADPTIVKEEPGRYTLFIKNQTPLLYDDIECLFADDHFAVEADRSLRIFARPFMRERHHITFKVKYRGEYQLGLRALRVRDLMGLFTLQRKLVNTICLTVFPRIVELNDFPLSMNLLSQSHSNFEIKEEDYATVSDIRQYQPTDSIKRVHWKLTAKKNEWLVKNFQSNALSRLSIIMDTTKYPLSYEETLVMEDRIIETALAVSRFCLRRLMPVDYIVSEGIKASGLTLGDFGIMYSMAAGLDFSGLPEENIVLAMLNKSINDSAGYINALVMTSSIDILLYERIASANHSGHYIVLFYFAPPRPDNYTERYFRTLMEGGIPCFRIVRDFEFRAA